MMNKETNETKQFHRKNLWGLDLINPEVNKFTIRQRFIVRITLLVVNLTIVTEPSFKFHKNIIVICYNMNLQSTNPRPPLNVQIQYFWRLVFSNLMWDRIYYLIFVII